jgi:hypothetical protein
MLRTRARVAALQAATTKPCWVETVILHGCLPRRRQELWLCMTVLLLFCSWAQGCTQHWLFGIPISCHIMMRWVCF